MTKKRSRKGKLLRHITDATSFVPIFQCERSGGADDNFFDGMDSKGANVSMYLVGQPEAGEVSVYPPLVDPDPGNSSSISSSSGKYLDCPPPNVGMLQETIWSFFLTEEGSRCNYYDTYQASRMFTANVN
jgi:hypothetical protein